MRNLALLGGTAGCIAAGVYLYRRKLYSLETNLESSKIIIIETIKDWLKWKDFVVESCTRTRLFGLDCEWVSEANGHRHKIALVQIAPSDSLCFLVRLSKLGVCPPELMELLQSPEFIKVGVGIIDDAAKLREDYQVSCSCCVDLRYLVLSCDSTRHMLTGSKSLQSLAKDVLGIDMLKNLEITCSNWEKECLSKDEIQYAANDAIVGYLIAKKVCSLNPNLNPLSVLLNSSWQFSLIASRYDDFLDAPFRQRAAKAHRVVPNTMKKSQRTEYPAYRLSQKTRYENCLLQAPDGEVLCFCDRKRPQWYLDKGLAEIVSEEPFVVRLKFQPKSRAILDRKFYTLQKENRCVACGSASKLVRKNVIPYEYRKCMPSIMKGHSSHDVVLLCIKCHPQSDCKDLSLRQKLAKLSGVPVFLPKTVTNSYLKRVQTAAKALFHRYNELPTPRINELEDILREHYKVEVVDKNLLEEAKAIDCIVKNDQYSSHAEAVIAYFSSNEGLVKFCKLWRQHFLDSMKPKFMPEMWSVDHNQECLAIEIMLHHGGDKKLLASLGYSLEYVEELMSTDRVQKELERLRTVKRGGSVDTSADGEDEGQSDDEDNFDLLPEEAEELVERL